jgi:prepilin-type N-terminal cleavage/methylation domain-containing protein
MKFPPKSSSPDLRLWGICRLLTRNRGLAVGFTLIELLTAMVILTILVLILSQIMGLASFSWLTGQQRMKNLTTARACLDLIVRDIQDGVFRPDLAAFIDKNGTSIVTQGSTSYAFYTKRAGGGTRSMALVNYRLNQSSSASTLMRGALPVSWTAGLPSFAGSQASTIGLPELSTLTAANYSEVASGAVAFKLYFINYDPAGTPTTTSYSWSYVPWQYGSTKKTLAVGVALAVLDDRTEQLLVAQNALTTLTSDTAFSTTATLTSGLKDTWDANINKPTFYTLGHYPSQLRTGLKIFERIVRLPTVTP